ncbi:MAG: SAV_6107 family HEPN domain-containing protein [Pirellulales bacterium]
MTWKNLLDDGRVETHVTSKAELDDLRAVVARNLEDAAIAMLSDDNRFAIAYQAALLSSKMAIACTGYRVKGEGAHHTTFQALKLAMGGSVTKTADYFDRCRRKRNNLSYDSQGIVSSADAKALLEAAEKFHKLVESWIGKNYPMLA